MNRGTAMAGAGAGRAAYAFWESLSKHPITPPYLLHNRAFVGERATMMAYAADSQRFPVTLSINSTTALDAIVRSREMMLRSIPKFLPNIGKTINSAIKMSMP